MAFRVSGLLAGTLFPLVLLLAPLGRWVPLLRFNFREYLDDWQHQSRRDAAFWTGFVFAACAVTGVFIGGVYRLAS